MLGVFKGASPRLRREANQPRGVRVHSQWLYKAQRSRSREEVCQDASGRQARAQLWPIRRWCLAAAWCTGWLWCQNSAFVVGSGVKRVSANMRDRSVRRADGGCGQRVPPPMLIFIWRRSAGNCWTFARVIAENCAERKRANATHRLLDSPLNLTGRRGPASSTSGKAAALHVWVFFSVVSDAASQLGG